ncbi:hypothetical protein [Natronococcus sp. A-GB7]|uniref:hypothetical protein n=1 Tax=Natronococcus sp. A-GB7 TaxID=3037649 RepID=UPI00241E856F|nr:hypothetical protein [Natronococcus sp. A-GB7]MDG5821325.1 hypothetical protein [Natronococcus sp. A-GB7]
MARKKLIKNLLATHDPSYIIKAVNKSLQRHYLYRHHIRYNLLYNKFVKGFDEIPDPYTPIMVDPANVRLCGLSYHSNGILSVSKYTDTGKIVGGDWDLEKNCPHIKTSPKYRAVLERYKEDKSWEETGIYDELADYIEEYGSIDGCYTERDLKERYRHIDELYKSIKQNGYYSQRELTNNDPRRAALDEVCLNVGRNGQFVFGGGGWHRLAIANVLNIDKIPVHVIIRHSGWQKKREEALEGNLSIEHPDLNGIDN